MKRLLQLDAVDLYILAMLGKLYIRKEIATHLNLCPPAITNRIKKVKAIYPEFFKDVFGVQVLSPDGRAFAERALCALDLLCVVTHPAKIIASQKPDFDKV